MKKYVQYIKGAVITGLLAVTVLLYLRGNYTTAFSLFSFNGERYENGEKIAKEAFEPAIDDRLAYSGEEETPVEYNYVYNATALDPFFEKLASLEVAKKGKLNIVHIGDSHIQADVMTGVVRQRFQESFGNAGLGLVFPYSLIRTNGGHNVSFSSNIAWEVQKNIGREGDQVGISGYSLSTKNKNFVIELNLKNKKYAFNTLKIITPNNERFFEVATNVGNVGRVSAAPLRPTVQKMLTHKVSQGETLYGISHKYHTTVSKIQNANRLSSANIRIGQVLHIPTAEKVAAAPAARRVDLSEAKVLSGNSLFSYYTYEGLNVSDKIYLTPNSKSDSFTLSGIVLENNNSGIIYHAIGVNGAHFSDYNKSKLFFEQIKALEPDLIIVSLGTNETFGRMSADRYDEQATKFINALRNTYGECPILLTSPPPSLYKRKSPNPLCEEYADRLIDNSVKDNYSVFDLYRAVGGSQAMNRFIQHNLIAGDRVHYTRQGYLEQGKLFYDAFMSNYLNYKRKNKQPLKPILN